MDVEGECLEMIVSLCWFVSINFCTARTVSVGLLPKNRRGSQGTLMRSPLCAAALRGWKQETLYKRCNCSTTGHSNTILLNRHMRIVVPSNLHQNTVFSTLVCRNNHRLCDGDGDFSIIPFILITAKRCELFYYVFLSFLPSGWPLGLGMKLQLNFSECGKLRQTRVGIEYWILIFGTSHQGFLERDSAALGRRLETGWEFFQISEITSIETRRFSVL